MSLKPSEEPAVVGFVVTGIAGLAAHWGLAIDADLKAAITVGVGAVVALLVRRAVTPNPKVPTPGPVILPSPQLPPEVAAQLADAVAALPERQLVMLPPLPSAQGPVRKEPSA